MEMQRRQAAVREGPVAGSGGASRPAQGFDPYRRLPSSLFALLSEPTPGDVCSRIAAALAPLVRYDEVVVDVDGDRTSGLGPGWAEFSAHAVRRRDPVSSEDPFENPELERLADAYRRRGESFVVVPLVSDGAALGTLAVHRYRQPPFTRDEIGALHAFGELAALVLHNARLRAELERLAYTDSLTGLANRRGLEEALAERCGSGEPLSLLLVDLDGLKEVNDTLTYKDGDLLLVRVGETVAGQLSEGELGARLGGDEFVVVLPGAGESEAERRGALLAAAVERVSLPPEVARHFRGGSVVAVSARADEGPDQLIRRSSAELHERKRERRPGGQTSP